MMHYLHGSVRAGLLAMNEISGFTDYFNQFVKSIIATGSISHTGVITMTGEISQDDDGL